MIGCSSSKIGNFKRAVWQIEFVIRCNVSSSSQPALVLDLQFAYKSKISAIHCVNSVNETVNYYINNSGQVYVCTLDASKAFDRVNLLTLFKKLFERNMCPLFLRFLIPSYCNQKMHIK